MAEVLTSDTLSTSTTGLPAVRDLAPLYASAMAGIPDDGGRNLGVISFHNPNAILSKVLITDVKGIAINHRLDHRRIQKA